MRCIRVNSTTRNAAGEVQCFTRIEINISTYRSTNFAAASPDQSLAGLESDLRAVASRVGESHQRAYPPLTDDLSRLKIESASMKPEMASLKTFTASFKSNAA